jgi:hypothetical protein
VTKFAQASIFSGFNNLNDLTMNPEFNDVCGFTEKEFDAYFSEYLPGILEYRKTKGYVPTFATIDDLKKEIFDYYDGYSWDGKNRVLNPFSLIKFLSGKEFEDFWFSSGTPTFLLEHISKNPLEYSRTDDRRLTKTMLRTVSVKNLKLVPLLFQTGYLTIEKKIAENEFALKIPNHEVAQAFSDGLSELLIGLEAPAVSKLRTDVADALANFDSAELTRTFGVILGWTSHQQWARVRESFQHAQLFVALKALSFDVVSEVSSSEGIFDVLIKTPPKTAFICEFKHLKFENKTGEKDEVVRKKLLTKALDLAKEQMATRRYGAEWRDGFHVVKSLAVGFVGNSDVVAEIY